MKIGLYLKLDILLPIQVTARPCTIPRYSSIASFTRLYHQRSCFTWDIYQC